MNARISSLLALSISLAAAQFALLGARPVAAQVATTPSALGAADRKKYEEAIDLVNSWAGKGDHFERAFAILNDLAQRNARSADPIVGLAELRFRTASLEDAPLDDVMRLARRALQLDPASAGAYIVMAKVMLAQENWNAASAAADKAIGLAPNMPEAMFVKARVADVARRYDEAETWYRKAIERLTARQRRANLYYYIGRMYRDKEPMDVAKAAAAFETSAELSVDAPYLLNDVGAFFSNNTDRYDLAIRYFNRALAIVEFNQARTNLGLTLWAQWGDVRMQGTRGPAAAPKAMEPDAITALTGVTAEKAFVRNPLGKAPPNSSIAMLKLGMIKDVDAIPGGEENTALASAAHGNHLELAKMLVDRGANVNAEDRKDGSTPIFPAVRQRNMEMVRLLVQHGARLNVEDVRHKLLLEYALMGSKPDDAAIFAYLLERGADPAATNRSGTPLIGLAVLYGNRAAMDLLLRKYRADANARMGRDTVLGMAAARDDSDSVKLVRRLLDAGANPWTTYGGFDVLISLRGSNEAYSRPHSRSPADAEAEEGIVRANNDKIAMILEARKSVPRPASFGRAAPGSPAR